MTISFLDARQSVLRASQSTLGTAANDTLDTIFPKIDAELGKLFEDRNVTLSGGGTISVNSAGTSVSFSSSLVLTVNSKVAGGSPTTISLGSATAAFSADGNMLYATINRTAGTAVVTADQASLPQVLAANLEIFLLAKRIGTTIYFRNGLTIQAGRVGAIGGAGVAYDSSTTDSTTTGASATLAAFSTGVVRLTNASLASISGIPAGAAGQRLVIENQTGNSITLKNLDSGATAANQILTGTDASVSMSKNASFSLIYDATLSKWLIVGGTGSGSGNGTGKNYLSAITTSQSPNPNTGNGNFELGSTAGWSLFNTTLSYANSQAVTISLANPAVFTTSSAHNLSVGQAVSFTSTGSLPLPVAVNKTFYVSAVPSTTTFQITQSPYGGSTVSTLGSTQSGTHTFHAVPQLTTGTINSGASSVTSFGVISSGQIAGSFSLQTASSSNWTAGQGFITDAFNIDGEDQGKVLSFTASYKVTAGATNLFVPGNWNNSFALYAYDVTNGLWLSPVGSYSMTQTSGAGSIAGSFQTSINGTQYRLAVVCINYTLGAATIVWDDFTVGPVTTAGLANNTVVAMAYLSANVAIGGSVAVPLDVLVYDTAKAMTIGTGARFTAPVSGWYCVSMAMASTSNSVPLIVKNGTTSIAMGWNFQFGMQASTGSVNLQLNAGDFVDIRQTTTTTVVGQSGAGATYGPTWMSVMLIQGNIGAGSSNQVVAARYHMTAGGSFAANTPLNYETVDYDTNASVTVGSGWNFKAPSSGFYRVAFGSSITTTNTTGISVVVNGTKSYPVVTIVPGANGGEGNSSTDIYLNAGDTVDIRGTSTNTYVASSQNFVCIAKYSAPSLSPSSDMTIAMRAVNNAGTVITAGVTAQQIPFPTKDFDTTNSWNGSQFTAPVSGKYRVSCTLTGLGTNAELNLYLYKNGSFYSALAENGTFNGVNAASGSDSVNLNAGDTLTIITATNADGHNITLGTSQLAIERFGN